MHIFCLVSHGNRQSLGEMSETRRLKKMICCFKSKGADKKINPLQYLTKCYTFPQTRHFRTNKPVVCVGKSLLAAKGWCLCFLERSASNNSSWMANRLIFWAFCLMVPFSVVVQSSTSICMTALISLPPSGPKVNIKPNEAGWAAKRCICIRGKKKVKEGLLVSVRLKKASWRHEVFPFSTRCVINPEVKA